MTETLTTTVMISFIVFAMLFASLGGFAAAGMYEMLNIALIAAMLTGPSSILMVASASFMPGAYQLDKMKPKADHDLVQLLDERLSMSPGLTQQDSPSFQAAPMLPRPMIVRQQSVQTAFDISLRENYIEQYVDKNHTPSRLL